MRIDLHSQTLAVESGSLRIIDSRPQPRSSFQSESIILDPSFFRDHLPDLSEGSAPELASWQIIQVLVGGTLVPKAISISNLQSAVDKKNDRELRFLAAVKDTDSIVMQRLAMVRSILKEGEISETVRGEALRFVSADLELYPILKAIVHNGVSEEDRGVALCNVLSSKLCSNHDFKLTQSIEMLLSSGPIYPSDRGRAVVLAASSNSYSDKYIDVVKQLLASGPITEMDRSYAVLISTYCRSTKIIRELLTSEISPETAWLATQYANLVGPRELVTSFLDKGFTIADSGAPLERTPLAGLLDRIPTADIVYDKMILTLAATRGDLEILRKLSTISPYLDSLRGLAVLYAVLGGHAELTNSLLKIGKLLDDDYFEAVKAAAGMGFEDILKDLLIHRPDIRVDALKHALNEGSYKGQERIVRSILEENEASASGVLVKQYRFDAANQAVMGNQKEIFNLLVGGLELTEDNRLELLKSGVRSGSEEILDQILDHSPISDTVIDQLFGYINEGRILRLLLQKLRISSECYSRMVDSATVDENEEFLSILQSWKKSKEVMVSVSAKL